jgi:hypothetical protein
MPASKGTRTTVKNSKTTEPELLASSGPDPLLFNHETSAPRHPHRGLEEQLAFLKIELGRTKRRVRTLEQQALEHAHDGQQQPPLRNGMYIDSVGAYWMHRPDGWHYCYIFAKPGMRPGHIDGGPTGHVQRLAEPKD